MLCFHFDLRFSFFSPARIAASLNPGQARQGAHLRLVFTTCSCSHWLRFSGASKINDAGAYEKLHRASRGLDVKRTLRMRWLYLRLGMQMLTCLSLLQVVLDTNPRCVSAAPRRRARPCLIPALPLSTTIHRFMICPAPTTEKTGANPGPLSFFPAHAK